MFTINEIIGLVMLASLIGGAFGTYAYLNGVYRSHSIVFGIVMAAATGWGIIAFKLLIGE